jgi:hypothetical protein
MSNQVVSMPFCSRSPRPRPRPSLGAGARNAILALVWGDGPRSSRALSPEFAQGPLRQLEVRCGRGPLLITIGFIGVGREPLQMIAVPLDHIFDEVGEEVSEID